MSVRPSVGPSVRRSVGWSVTLSSKTREIDIFVQIVKKVHVIMSSCNNYISKRTHRWPHGPCFTYQPNRPNLYFFVKIKENRYLLANKAHEANDASSCWWNYLIMTWLHDCLTIWSKISISLVFDESVTNQPTDWPTDRRTDRPGYRDARTHLKTRPNGQRCVLKHFSHKPRKKKSLFRCVLTSL